MKNVTINTAAAWVTTVRTFQDGDVFRESNIDLAAGDVADRLGYLKNALDAKAGLAADNTFTGANTFDDSINVDGDVIASGALEGGNATLTGALAVGADLSFSSSSSAGVKSRYMTGAVAADTITAAYDHVRVPTLTASRVWTVEDDPAPRDGATIEFYRPGSDAFTLTIRRETALGGVTTLGVLNSAAPGTWLKILFKSGHWVVAGQSSDVSSLAATV